MTTRPAAELTLADRVSHLTYAQACRILGLRAKELLRAGGMCEIVLDEQIRRGAERFVLELPDARVSLELADRERVGLACRCSACAAPCEHAGAALALILEEKLALGLAAPPLGRLCRHQCALGP